SKFTHHGRSSPQVRSGTDTNDYYFPSCVSHVTLEASSVVLIAVIGDEDTCTGFLLGGIGELNKNRKPNFLVVEKDTSITEIEETFKSFLARSDIGIILINQFIAEMIRHAIDAHMQSIPAVLEIPSKEHPYDASKDSILRRAKGMFSAEDFR
uniref:V-type proton ATPase subunit F n=1 Tax=Astyanax mexicanus TaxID=7994 RepID=A0A8B9JYB2_ASTMX